MDLDQRDMWQLNRFFLFCGLVAGMLAISPAQAGDKALLEAIGFSSDERYFAFEEYGIQDGSGFAYSTTYVIDLSADRWVVGTPVHLQSDDEDESLYDLRQRSHEEARSRLYDLEIFLPAQLAAAIGDGVPGEDGQILSFGLPGFSGPGSVVGKYTLSLETFTAPSGAPCMDWFGEQANGFALKIEDFGAARETHRDRTLPRSRGCPVSYRIRAVYLPYQATDISRSVALISVYAYGFEGLDRRFIAVPLAYTF